MGEIVHQVFHFLHQEAHDSPLANALLVNIVLNATLKLLRLLLVVAAAGLIYVQFVCYFIFLITANNFCFIFLHYTTARQPILRDHSTKSNSTNPWLRSPCASISHPLNSLIKDLLERNIGFFAISRCGLATSIYTYGTPQIHLFLRTATVRVLLFTLLV